MLAPVVLFVYNRIDHVKKTLEALSENVLANKTEAFIFSDGAKNNGDAQAVAEVRNFLREKRWETAFKKITLIESPENKGLANSIISGVDQIIHKYGRVIVLEDDCVSRKDFLMYMNKCLDFYSEDPLIWSIGGYTVNIQFPNDYISDVYIMGRTCSYAWGTWENRWDKVDWNVSDYSSFKWNYIKRKEFNKYGNDRARMLDLQQLGRKNSWAIRFCYAMFRNRQYTVYPRETRIKNIGYDVGTHVSGNSDEFVVDLKNEYSNVKLEHLNVVNENIRRQYVKKFNRPIYKLAVSYVENVIIRR